MGIAKKHPPVKYFAGLTFNHSANLNEIFSLLEDLFSKITLKSEIFDFSAFTQYYKKEMGDKLEKQFLVFENLESPELLTDYKIKTNNIENRYSIGNKRQINIDPGYLSDAKIVLATTKNYDHRIHIKDGIFADLHLKFSNKSFLPQPWTYPDYKQSQIIKFFNDVRQRYFHQLGEKYHRN